MVCNGAPSEKKKRVSESVKFSKINNTITLINHRTGRVTVDDLTWKIGHKTVDL
jgi:hypothetical protein